MLGAVVFAFATPEKFDETLFQRCTFFRLALPNDENFPASAFQNSDVLGVPLGVARELGAPIALVGFRPARIEALFIRVQMPETAMHKNNFTARPENKIRLAGQIGGVKPVAVAEGVDKTADDKFGRGIFGADSCHVGGAAGWG